MTMPERSFAKAIVDNAFTIAVFIAHGPLEAARFSVGLDRGCIPTINWDGGKAYLGLERYDNNGVASYDWYIQPRKPSIKQVL